MSDPYLAGVVWRLANMSERERREADEQTGRLVAGVVRGLGRMLRPVRRARSAARSRAVGRRRPVQRYDRG